MSSNIHHQTIPNLWQQEIFHQQNLIQVRGPGIRNPAQLAVDSNAKHLAEVLLAPH
jgi:hypothetical protein